MEELPNILVRTVTWEVPWYNENLIGSGTMAHGSVISLAIRNACKGVHRGGLLPIHDKGRYNAGNQLNIRRNSFYLRNRR